jgi:hypothetical protein
MLQANGIEQLPLNCRTHICALPWRNLRDTLLGVRPVRRSGRRSYNLGDRGSTARRISLAATPPNS